MHAIDQERKGFPVSAGILFGLGLGGFFDGIVLHQILQWHHMLSSAGYPPDSVHNLKVDTLWDGLFHASTYLFVLAGLVILLVEGVVDHQILGIHHVNETVPADQWIYWDIGFLVWGAAMLAGGWVLLRAGKKKTRIELASPRSWP